MKNQFLLIACFFVTTSLFSQQEINIQNINHTITDTKIVITFDMNTEDQVDRTFDLVVEMILPEKTIIPSKGITGHIGQRKGTNKQITWYYTTAGYSKRDLTIDELDIKIRAINPNPPYPKKDKNIAQTKESSTPVTKSIKKPSLVPSIVVMGVGVGAGIFGLSTKGKADDEYAIYSSFECLEGESFTNTCWEDAYESANSKKKTGEAFMIAGGAVVATGVYLLIRSANKRKKAGFSFQPEFDLTPDNQGSVRFVLTKRF